MPCCQLDATCHAVRCTPPSAAVSQSCTRARAHRGLPPRRTHLTAAQPRRYPGARGTRVFYSRCFVSARVHVTDSAYILCRIYVTGTLISLPWRDCLSRTSSELDRLPPELAALCGRVDALRGRPELGAPRLCGLRALGGPSHASSATVCSASAMSDLVLASRLSSQVLPQEGGTAAVTARTGWKREEGAGARRRP